MLPKMIHRTCCFFLLTLLFSSGYGQSGLMVNEISNGRFTDREYVELLAVKDCPTTDSQFLDIRGWLIDDNNGDFSCGAIQDVGIRTGHVRFDSSGNWDSIPFGAMILLYNNGAKNSQITMPDDPTDANGDGLYVVPLNYIGIEYTAMAPRGDGACGAIGPFADPSYNSSTPYYNGNPWGQRIQLRDLGDASQVRRPDGSYFHGISYGIGDMAGGPDNLQIGFGTGTRKAYYFNGGDFRLASNYDSVPNVFSTPTLQTPGLPNNALNQNFIDSIQAINCSGPLPILLAAFQATLRQDHVELTWASALEMNSESYIVERADHGQTKFKAIGSVRAAGHSADFRTYTFTDTEPSPGTSFYRLRSVDQDGAYALSSVRSIQYIGQHLVFNILYPNPVTDFAHFDFACESSGAIYIADLTGRIVKTEQFPAADGFRTLQMDLSDLGQGLYVYVLRAQNGSSASGRLVKW